MKRLTAILLSVILLYGQTTFVFADEGAPTPTPEATESATPTPEATTNLVVQNPGFEEVDPADATKPNHWNHGSYSDATGSNDAVFNYLTTGGRSGTAAANIEITTHTPPSDAKWYFENIAVTSGMTYQYSGWYKSDVATVLYIQYTLANGSTVNWLKDAPAATDWTELKVTFTPIAGAVSFTIFQALEQAGSLTIDDISVTEATPDTGNTFANGFVTLAFDDGWISHYDPVRTKLNQEGFKGSFYIITDELTIGSSEYMTPQQVQDLYADGHEIGSHTMTHCSLSGNASDTGDDAIVACKNADGSIGPEDEINGAKAALIALGIDPLSTLVYPYGDYNDAVIDLLKAAGFIGARTVEPGFNTKKTDPFKLQYQEVDMVNGVVDVAKAQEWIDTAIADKTWLIITFHQVVDVDPGDNYSTTPAIFNGIVDYLKSSNTEVVTMKDGIGRITGTVAPTPTPTPSVSPSPTADPSVSPSPTATVTPTPTPQSSGGGGGGGGGGSRARVVKMSDDNSGVLSSDEDTPDSSENDDTPSTETNDSVANTETGDSVANTEDTEGEEETPVEKALFADIVGHWGKFFIEELAKHKVVNGYGDDHFGPDTELTRAEALKIALVAFDFEIATDVTEESFKDVELTAWYAPYIQTGKAAGIASGFGTDMFLPNKQISRAEALKMIATAAKVSEADFTAEESDFSDVAKDAWYIPYIEWAVEKKIVSGYPNGTFGPNQGITRAEFSKITYLALQQLSK